MLAGDLPLADAVCPGLGLLSMLPGPFFVRRTLAAFHAGTTSRLLPLMVMVLVVVFPRVWDAAFPDVRGHLQHSTAMLFLIFMRLPHGV